MPWTVLANTALAVSKNEQYVEVELDGEKLILAKALVDKALTNEKHQVLPYTVLRTFSGEELVGKRYEPAFKDRGQGAHKVHHASFVTLDEGTGVVSLAPAYGEEDYIFSKEANFPLVTIIDDNGLFTDSEWKGQQVWDANKDIAKTLHERGQVWKIDYIRHSYPHCHRCGTKLVYRAHPSWFMNVKAERRH
jgi:isoleucyl-tRNA synthetase